MARITGKYGQIKVGSTVIADITDWSLDLKIPVTDATAMRDAFKKNLSLIREWSGTVKGWYGNADEQNLTIASFFAATTVGGATSGAITLSLWPDAAGTENFSGSAYLDFSISADKGKTTEFTAKFTGTDTLTHTP